MVLVVSKAEHEFQRSFKQNVFIAAFTTSLAHLKLYEALDFLGDRVLYYNTDSVHVFLAYPNLMHMEIT